MAKVLSPDRQTACGLIRSRYLCSAFFSLCLSALCLPSPQLHADTADPLPETASGFAATQTARARQAMVVTAHPLASEAALDVLKRGGHAVDAAIAAQLVLGLVEPQSSGIGGGAFLLHWSARDKKLASYDGRETAPANITPEHFLREGAPLPFMDAVISGKSVGTPGVVAMLALTHKQHGRLPWRDLFNPAIKLARDGFAISPRLNQSLAWILTQSSAGKVAGNNEFRDTYFNADGTPRNAGEQLRNPAYAVTLQRIANGGADAFYKGDIANAIVTAVHSAARPGTLSTQDLARYEARERAPLCRAFLTYTICGAPPPSSGAFTVLSIVGILEQLPASRDPLLFAHRFAEASRLAFADRNTYLADPDFVPQPLDALLDSPYLKRRAALIAPRASTQPAQPGDIKLSWQPARSPELPSTSHLVITDATGNVASMTTSIEMGFGSQQMTRGFLLNNQLTDFSFAPREGSGKWIANRIEPGKRPRSSMAPVIVFERGEPVLAIGSPGGSRIIDYVARVLVQHLRDGQPLDAAIAAPHVLDLNDRVEIEQRADADQLAAALEKLGHNVTRREQPSGVNAIRWIRSGKEFELLGVADPRREGQAVGF